MASSAALTTGVDLGADGLDSGEADALAHPVDPDHRLEEEPIGQLGGFRPEGADLQGLLEDVTQLGLTVGGDPLERVVDVARLQCLAPVLDGRALGGVAVSLNGDRLQCGQQGGDGVEHGVLLCLSCPQATRIVAARP